MSKDKYTSLDELIKKSLQEKAERDKDIDLDEAWEKFRKRYHIRKQRNYSRILAIACSLFVFLGAFLVFMPSEGKALNIKVFETIKSFLSGKVQTTHISFSSQKEQKNTEDYLSPEVSSTLKSVPYEVLLPDMLGTYKIESAEVSKVGTSHKVTIALKDPNGKHITMTQMNIIGDFSQGNSYDTEDAIMKEVNINGQEASLIIYKNGFTKLAWIDRDIFISLMGEISEDNILMLASATRRLTLH